MKAAKRTNWSRLPVKSALLTAILLPLIALQASAAPLPEGGASGLWKNGQGVNFRIPESDSTFEIYIERPNGAKTHAKAEWVDVNKSFTYVIDGTNHTVYTATFDPHNHNRLEVHAPGIGDVWTRKR